MIARNKLYFDERDLKFFDQQRDRKIIELNATHKFIIFHIQHGERITGRELARLLNVSTETIRNHIAQIRRYTDAEQFFITANNNGYTMSCYDFCCEDDLIHYFNKTQNRFKETFNELCNLMKGLNRLNKRERK